MLVFYCIFISFGDLGIRFGSKLIFSVEGLQHLKTGVFVREVSQQNKERLKLEMCCKMKALELPTILIDEHNCLFSWARFKRSALTRTQVAGC